MRRGYDQTSQHTPPPRRPHLENPELGPRRTELAHEGHFLSRALRCEGEDLDRAMRLYHHSKLVRVVLEHRLKDQPEAERVAIPLRGEEPTPRVVMTRGGRFITCLDETMACTDLPHLPYEAFASAISHVEGRRAELKHQLALLRRYDGKEIALAVFEGPGHLHRDMAQVLIDCEFDRQLCGWLIKNLRHLGRFATLYQRGLLTRRRAIDACKLEGSVALLCYLLAGVQSPAVAGILDFYARRDTGFEPELMLALSRQPDGDERLHAMARDPALPPERRALATSWLASCLLVHRPRVRTIMERLASLPVAEGRPGLREARASAAQLAAVPAEQLDQALDQLAAAGAQPPASPCYLRTEEELARFALTARPALELFAPKDVAPAVREAWDRHLRTRQLPPPPRPDPVVRTTPRIGRNEPCPCGSGRKHKHCCLDRPGAAGPSGQ